MDMAIKRPKFRLPLFSKIGKIIICLVLAFVFTYVKPKHEAEAVLAPIAAAAWTYVIQPMLIAIAIEEAKKIGIKFIDKTQAKKHATEIVEKAKAYLKDSDIKRTLDKNGKKVKFTVASGVIALLTFLWGEYADKHEDTCANKTANGTCFSGSGGTFGEGDTVPNPIPPVDGYVLGKIQGEYANSHPLYNTAIQINLVPYNNDQLYARSIDFFKKSINVVITPIAFGQRSKVEFYLKTTGELLKTNYVAGGTVIDLIAYQQQHTQENVFRFIYAYYFDSNHDYISDSTYYHTKLFQSETSMNGAYSRPMTYYEGYRNGSESSNYPGFIVTDFNPNNSTAYINYLVAPNEGMRGAIKLYTNYLVELVNNNKTYVFADGMHVQDNTKYLKYPSDYPEDLNSLVTVLGRLGVVVNDIDIELDLSDIEGLDLISLDDDDSLPNLRIEDKTDGVIVIDPDDLIPVINPKYELTDEKQNIINQIVIEINNGGIGGGGGSVAPIDGGLIAYVRNSYDYAVSAVQTGVDGLQKVTSGFIGITAIAGSVFAFMPEEMSIYIIGAFLITIGLWVVKR